MNLCAPQERECGCKNRPFLSVTGPAGERLGNIRGEYHGRILTFFLLYLF